MNQLRDQDTASNIWASCVERLRTSLPSTTYDIWLKSVSATDYSNGQLELLVPTAWHKEWIEQRLYGPIQSLLCEMGMPLSRLIFKVDDQGRRE